jgi:hypothetical protein
MHACMLRMRACVRAAGLPPSKQGTESHAHGFLLDAPAAKASRDPRKVDAAPADASYARRIYLSALSIDRPASVGRSASVGRRSVGIPDPAQAGAEQDGRDARALGVDHAHTHCRHARVHVRFIR